MELLDVAFNAGIKAKYVLFDSWYASPRMFFELLKRGRFGIGMLKRTKKVYFRYRGRQMDVKTLYRILCSGKRPTRDDYFYSPIVKFEVDGQEMPVKLVYVSNRGASNQYLVLATTKIGLRPKEIIQMYGRRWQIEGYFKVANSTCSLIRPKSKVMTAFGVHMALVMMSYDILALAQRQNIDERTLGDLFFEYGRALPDIPVAEALSWLMRTLSGLGRKMGMSSEALDTIFEEFTKALPSSLARLLGSAG
ncbi:transposase [Levilactobacillus brevis]|uniref:transposase n=1 Tax=Levilactobacillus brevis TaxID=1580 RepID=UPI0005B6DC72|nr:transposase [Levilactobacillus brevis]KIO97145.1 Mobile element protein [Levilactobacillus brevis]